ncbi:cardiolipin synthase [Pseudoruegeria sp. SK021]|uniref:cardiolipin synthase n=1 Tax=Pseudoruegeria sp. SK021 TaxID=1933035 RepID=UPI000A233813|nr:cardiolipin synthase [Pseudoruegeria sp. SK021]OSP54053.1 cardiolipin synthase [Pseudoruegeria sp. SK021]
MIAAAHILVQALLIVRVLLRPHRDPTSRLAWMVVILVVPFFGIAAYLLLGETNIGRSRVRRLREVTSLLPAPSKVEGHDDPALHPVLSDRHRALFMVGTSISGYEVIGGNDATLMADSLGTIDSMVADIEAATDHVHLLFYIWLPDTSGHKIGNALIRAAARGVTCRALVDDMGSRTLIKSDLWREMGAAGVHLERALKVGNPLIRILNGRIDLRNHRKVLVIDNRIAYCGSQNCADPDFLPKAKFAPWVDVMIRFTGPVVRQNAHLFAGDWMANGTENIVNLLTAPLEPAGPGFPAQVITTGPTTRHSAAPEMFTNLIFAARRKLIITTPYYVPVSSLQAAICAAANRGVETTIIFPARNDDFAVAATCHSYYEELLDAGVKIFEYLPGVLHAKTMTVDDDLTLIGSANMDRRSFELNFENNVLVCCAKLTAEMQARQQSFLDQSRQVTAEEVAAWSWRTRLANNALAIVGPVL